MPRLAAIHLPATSPPVPSIHLRSCQTTMRSLAARDPSIVLQAPPAPSSIHFQSSRGTGRTPTLRLNLPDQECLKVSMSTPATAAMPPHQHPPRRSAFGISSPSPIPPRFRLFLLHGSLLEKDRALPGPKVAMSEDICQRVGGIVTQRLEISVSPLRKQKDEGLRFSFSAWCFSKQIRHPSPLRTAYGAPLL